MTADGSPLDGTFVDKAQTCGDTGAAAMLAAVQRSRPGKVMGYDTDQTVLTPWNIYVVNISINLPLLWGP